MGPTQSAAIGRPTQCGCTSPCLRRTASNIRCSTTLSGPPSSPKVTVEKKRNSERERGRSLIYFFDLVFNFGLVVSCDVDVNLSSFFFGSFYKLEKKKKNQL